MAIDEWKSASRNSLLKVAKMEKLLLEPSISAIQPSNNGIRNIDSKLIPVIYNFKEQNAYTSIFRRSTGIFLDKLSSSKWNINIITNGAAIESKCSSNDCYCDNNFCHFDGVLGKSS